jgi:3-dehydroquinate dehydratase type I
MPKICVSIPAETTDQTIEGILRLDLADLIETRIDYRKEQLNFISIRKSTNIPLIATNRRIDQGGRAEEPESARIQMLRNAIRAGFEYVDLASNTEDLEKIVSELREMGAKIIVSSHEFEHSLDINQLEKRHYELIKTGCDVIKIIGWAHSYEDNLPYLDYNKRHPGNVSFGMGKMGTISRILAPLAGAEYTYASMDTGLELAPGQIPFKVLRETYRRIT